MRNEFQGISASVAFDTIMDGEYRRLWDENVIDDFEICRLNNFDDIGYYSSKYNYIFILMYTYSSHLCMKVYIYKI